MRYITSAADLSFPISSIYTMLQSLRLHLGCFRTLAQLLPQRQQKLV